MPILLHKISLNYGSYQSIISFLVNDSPTKQFKPLKGLRKGDALALFLFVINCECLAREVMTILRKMYRARSSKFVPKNKF